MKKAVFVLVVLVLGVSGLRAQHFEWVKGYSSSQESNIIKGSVTDSAGNLYILGQFRNTAAWDGGSHLLPIAPYGYGSDVLNVLIAKITPDGTMAWKKVLHGNNGQGANAWDIKPVGDSAFACLVHFSLPRTNDNYLYYLDTLLPNSSDYPIPEGNMSYATRTALITFDFEGNVLEQHFMTLTYLDNDGNDLMRHVVTTDYYINSSGLGYLSFDIDNEGNIYLCRVGADLVDQTYASWRGNVGGIKYWVDGRVVGQSEVRNSPLMWYPQLLKFSPHMDSLLASRYLVQRCDTNVDYQTDRLYMKLDSDGNPYVIGTISHQEDYNNVIIDSIKNISFPLTPFNHWKAYLLKLNNALQVTQCITLKDSIISDNSPNANTMFQDITFDYDSNYMFVNAGAGIGVTITDTINLSSILSCQNIPLTNLRNDAFIMTFRRQSDTLKFVSYGRVLAKYTSASIAPLTHGTISCSKNRVFMQSDNMGGIRYPGQSYTFNNWGNWGLGLNIFDYKGNVIDGIFYYCISSSNEVGSTTLHQNTLYLTNVLTAAATFGDIHVPAQGYNACIAKYVDTAFMTPYVHTGDTADVRVVVDDGGAWVSYPNPFRQRVNIEVENGGLKVERAWLTDLTGRREEVRLQPNGPNRYVLDLTGRPQASYLLTLVTADGQERTLRLLKQSDMFGE